MKYEIKTDKNIYEVTEENGCITINTESLYEFLIDLDECNAPMLIMKEEKEEELVDENR